MAEYRRYHEPGGTYFFTVVTQGRAPILCLPEARAILRTVFLECRNRWPFTTHAIVLLPDHLHAIWSLPRGDDRYSARLGWIKKEFTKRWLEIGGREQVVSESRRRRDRKGVWQPRFWEHCIGDEVDLGCHADYIHYNPVKHGLVRSPRDWPHSSFHRWVRDGSYDPDWGRGVEFGIERFRGLDSTAME